MKSPLEQLLDASTLDIDAVFKRISAGCNPNTTNASGDTFLHRLVNEVDRTGRLTEDAKKAIKQLIENHAVSANTKNGKGQTPLQVLMNKITWTIPDAYLLVELGADANVLNEAGESLLHRIVSSAPILESAETLSSLVEKFRVDPNLKDGRNRTPLQRYLDRGSWGINGAMYLLCLGADPYTFDSSGQSLIHRFATQPVTLRVSLYARLAITHLVRTFKLDPLIKNAQGLNVIECLVQSYNWEQEDVEFFERLKKDIPIELPNDKSQDHAACSSSSGAASSHSVLPRTPVRTTRMRQLTDEEINGIVKPLKDYAEKTFFGFHYHSFTSYCLQLISALRHVKRLPSIQIELEYILEVFEICRHSDIDKFLPILGRAQLDACKTIQTVYKKKEDSGYYRAVSSALNQANQISTVLQPVKEEKSSLPSL